MRRRLITKKHLNLTSTVLSNNVFMSNREIICMCLNVIISLLISPIVCVVLPLCVDSIEGLKDRGACVGCEKWLYYQRGCNCQIYPIFFVLREHRHPAQGGMEGSVSLLVIKVRPVLSFAPCKGRSNSFDWIPQP